MRKLTAVAIIIAIIIVQMTAGIAFADKADIKTALQQLNSLSYGGKGIILAKFWDYSIAESSNNIPVTAEGVYNKIKTDLSNIANPNDSGKSLWQTIVCEGGGYAGDGQISAQNLSIVVTLLVDNKELVAAYYGLFKEKADAFSVLIGRQLDGNFFAELCSYTEAIITSDADGKFTRKIDVSQKMADRLNTTKSTIELLVGDVNTRVNEFVNMLNESNEDPEGVKDIIDVLTIFGLYAAPGTGNVGGNLPPEGSVDDIDDQLGDLVNNGGDTAANVDKALDLISSAADVIKNIQDPAAALSQATQIIETSRAIIDAVGNKGEYNEELSDALVDLANTVMEKINTSTVEAVLGTGGTLNTVLGANAVGAMLDKLDKIVSTADALNNALDKSGVDSSVKAVLNIKVESQYSAQASAVEIPALLFATANDKKIDMVAIDTGIATVTLAPESYLNKGPVRLETNKVDSSTLPADVKAAVGNSVVYDFNLTVGETKISKFKKPVEISVPYTLNAGENPDKISVFYINDNGKLENEVGFYNEATKTVTFTVKHFSKYAVKVNNVTFKDIASVGWAKQGIEAMAAKGVIKGVGNDKFNPSAKVTRGQFIAMIVRAMKLSDDTAVSSFTDVKKDNLFYNEISSAYSLGIVSGVGNNKFAPEANITRQDAAVIIANTLSIIKEKKMPEASSSYLNKYTDKVKIAEYAKPAAALVGKYSIILGDAKADYNPKGLATRAEAALIIYRLFNVK